MTKHPIVKPNVANKSSLLYFTITTEFKRREASMVLRLWINAILFFCIIIILIIAKPQP